MISALLGVGLAALLIWGWNDEKGHGNEGKNHEYYRNEGKIFGTYYNIRYQASTDLHDSITAASLCGTSL